MTPCPDCDRLDMYAERCPKHQEPTAKPSPVNLIATFRARAAIERRALVVAERIAQADSYLHDVSLPGYGETAAALSALYKVMLTAPYGADPRAAMAEARRVVLALEEVKQ